MKTITYVKYQTVKNGKLAPPKTVGSTSTQYYSTTTYREVTYHGKVIHLFSAEWCSAEVGSTS